MRDVNFAAFCCFAVQLSSSIRCVLFSLFLSSVLFRLPSFVMLFFWVLTSLFRFSVQVSLVLFRCVRVVLSFCFVLIG